MSLTLTTFPSPIGPLAVAARNGRVCLLHFDARPSAVRAVLGKWYPDEPIEQAADAGRVSAALSDYFGGRLGALDEIEVEMHGTPFQLRVWGALREIPAGGTASYSAIARRIGAGDAVRAVGAANGANPIAVVVPCHRVIGASGHLTGYGGGIDRKRWLLHHEGYRTLF
jgi:methylated-DNA-[protein]-cysteine S-methyltransferase